MLNLSPPKPTLNDLPPTRRVFTLNGDATITFTARTGGCLCNGVFHPGWSFDDLVAHYLAVWAGIGIKAIEEPVDCQIVVNGDPVGPRMTVDDAVQWFMVLQATFRKVASGTVVTVMQDGVDKPVLTTANK